jgi:hypothetical protein
MVMFLRPRCGPAPAARKLRASGKRSRSSPSLLDCSNLDDDLVVPDSVWENGSL